jgi:hypothetical protein
MSSQVDQHHEDLVQEVAIRMESSRLTRRPSRNSTGLNPNRYSARIEKPRSNHPSPRGPERRRTVSAMKQYASLDDHYRIMFGLDVEEKKDDGCSQQHQVTRPVSWHPSSSHFQVPHSRIPARTSLQSPRTTLQTTASNITAQSRHHLDYNRSLGAGTPLPLYNDQQSHHIDIAWSSYMHGQVIAESQPPSYSSLSYHATSWFASDYDQSTAAAQQCQYAPSETLPLQQPTAQYHQDSNEGLHRLVRKKSDELIGLGLYDPPESSPPSFGGAFTPTGKGLKLEETWQPPEEMEDDEEEEEEEESSDEDEEPLKQVEQQWQQTALPIMNMSGQSFLFENEDGVVANEWWYQQMKQSAAVPRDGTLNYNWF